MDDDRIEDLLRALIEEHLTEPERTAATDWLERRARTYKAVVELGLVDDSSA